MKINDEIKSLIILNSIPFLTPRKIKNLIDKFGTASNILNASIEELTSVENITEIVANRILNWKSKVNPDKEIEQILKNDIKIISYFDENYPSLLKNLEDPPMLLYVKGNLESIYEFSLSVVGTRKPTSYGKIVTEHLIKELSKYRFTIISGLAYGIDKIAHECAIKNGLKTIAVLGNGLGIYYPLSNKKLQNDIPLKGGCLISEFSYFRRPDKLTFPQRNRIIAALSLATIVIEADIKSGALITAKFAADMGKEVFAVPGSIFSNQSRGTNFLIKTGAKMVTCVEDIIEEIKEICYSLKKDFSEYNKGNTLTDESMISEDERKVLDIISSEPNGLHIDKIQYISNIEINKLLNILLRLQILGKIKEIHNKTFIVI
ncbi:MAG: DNA-processing protein DprA [Endomicrobiia bacterium]